MTSLPPPPPPPPPATPGTTTPWYKASGMPLILGILAAAAVAIPSYLVFSGDDKPAASGSSTTTTTIVGATTTTKAETTTTASGTTATTAATTTTAGVTTTVVGTTTTAAGTTTTATTPALDTGLEPNFGSASLAAGFAPDPFTEGVASGGSIDASYLGGPCLGWATAAPDFEIVWSGSTGTLLRFYFIADTPGDDTVLIVNDPAGAWWCGDDYSPGTRNPLIDFPTGPNGTYDVWVASFAPETSVVGTLYVTELGSNHP